MNKVALFYLALAAYPVLAQLTVEQKVVDFQTAQAVYAKRYAPYEWKKQAFGFDALDSAPWLDRVRKSKDDLEFYEILAEFTARLNDTHSSFRVGSSFVADLGIVVDIYDGKLLIEAINRVALPLALFPFQVGDELVTLDGKIMEEYLTEFGRLYSYGNPQTARRNNADLITFRRQSRIPRAVELGDSAIAVIRRANGDLETYTLPWVKSGFPLRNIGSVPSPKLSAGSRAASDESVPEYMKLIQEIRNWRADDLTALEGTTYDEETGEQKPRRYLLGLGARAPVFALPANFVQRLGRSPADFHFSGVYESNGLKIGYLRVPAFVNFATSLRELADEIAFFQQNTDGLVVDVMRNGGGDCYMLSLASYLIPTPNFFFFGEEVRATLDRINSFQFALENSRRANAPQWVLDLYTAYLDQLTTAYRSNRGRTGPIPACSISFENDPARDRSGNIIAYNKPLIILVDEFSISAADIFPAMMQDNRRGVIVGTRTSGGGGSVSGWPLLYSESITTNTNSLVVRKQPIVTADLPTAPYVENIGTRPDIPLDYMTRDNLMSRGRPFVDAFTQIIADQIKSTGK